MPACEDDYFFWRMRAEEARALAERMHDEISKEMMVGIANDYDRAADELERRVAMRAKRRDTAPPPRP
jgi:hypothetical protein